MEVEVNWLAVLLAGLSSMVVGSIYYSRPVFGNSWQRLANLSNEKLKAAGLRPIVISVAANFVMAYVLAHITYMISAFFLDMSFMSVAVSTALWLWLGIAATTIIVHDSFESRPVKLSLLSIGNQLFTLLAMALIIGALRP